MRLSRLISLLAIFLLGVEFLLAQSPSNLCAGANQIQVNTSCTSRNGNTTNATASGRPACIGNPDDDMYYFFVATQTSHNVTVYSGGGGFNPAFEVIADSCTGPTIACENRNSGAIPEMTSLMNLTVGSRYYLRIYHAGSGSGSGRFRFCVYDMTGEPPCDPVVLEPANTMANCGSDIPKICNLNGLCGNTREFHTSPTTTAPYTDNAWSQLNTAFCGSIENNSFLRFTAASSSLGLTVYGSCATGTGIQMMVFERLSTAGPPCDNGNIQTYGCFNHMDLTPSPNNGVNVSFNGMTPGNEYYLMIDGFGGSVCDYKIAANFGVQISVDVTPDNPVVCLGSSVALNAIGGNGTYTWDTTAYLNTLSGQTVLAKPLTEGFHTIYVNSPSPDPACPAAKDSAVIEVIDAPNPNAGISQGMCIEDTLFLNAALGDTLSTSFWSVKPPPNVAQSMAMFSPNKQVLDPYVRFGNTGTFTLILNEDNPECGMTGDTIDIEVEGVDFEVDSVDVSCLGASDGQILFNSTFTLDYSVDNGTTYINDSVFGDLAVGHYYVSGISPSGCVAFDSIEILDGPQLELSTWGDTVICMNGTANLYAAFTPPIMPRFNWTHTNDDNFTVSVDPLISATYYVQGFNDLGCETSFDSIHVEVLDPIDLHLSEDVEICDEDSTLLTVNSSGGIGAPYNYQWTDFPAAWESDMSMRSYAPESSGYIYVRVEDMCESDPVLDSFFIEVHPLPRPRPVLLADYLCEPASFEIELDNQASEMANSYWFFTSGHAFTDQENVRIEDLMEGTYGLTVDLYSDKGCYGTINLADFLHSMPIPKAAFRIEPEMPTMNRPEVQCRDMSEHAVEWEWTYPGALNMNGPEEDPYLVYPDGEHGTYEVVLKVTSAYTCVDSTSMIINIEPETLGYIPNAFTPNEDSYNNRWEYEFSGIDEDQFEAFVYNRWGEVVFSSQDPNHHWDGSYRGEVVPDGVYSYRIRVHSKYTDEEKVFTGQLNILR